jgi:hypothetical protein
VTRDIPIIYSGPMIRSLLAGIKTETRRIGWAKKRGFNTGPLVSRYNPLLQSAWARVKPGDRLWVRENFSGEHRWSGIPPSGWGWDTMQRPIGFWYWADGNIPTHGDWTRPIPSIHMPRWASRMTLIVERVSTERLHTITEEAAQREGVHAEFEMDGHAFLRGRKIPKPTHRVGFKHIWQHLHGHEAWEMNPDVVVISFKVICANIDSEEAKAA